jgi:hypothetical protein
LTGGNKKLFFWPHHTFIFSKFGSLSLLSFRPGVAGLNVLTDRSKPFSFFLLCKAEKIKTLPSLLQYSH